MAEISEKDKIPKEYINAKKGTITSNFMIQLETSSPKENIGGIQNSKWCFILSGGKGAIVNLERYIPRKKEYGITCNLSSKKGYNSKSRY